MRDMTTSISVRELHDLIHSGNHIAVIDARWSRECSAFEHYSSGHIPLALFCDPPIDLVGIPDRSAGRNPLPEEVRIKEAIRRWGLSNKHTVVVYDSGDGLIASRAWWVLKWAGLEDVRVLRGGMQAWLDYGFASAYGPGNLPQPADLKVSVGQMPVVDVEEVGKWPSHGVLVDARELNRFEGRQERIDLQAGHIPGAVHLPARSLQAKDGGFLPAAEIRAKLAAIGVTSGDQVAVYSGSGLHSSLFIQAMYEAGMEGASLFVGGWSKWAGDPALPIVRL